MPFSWLALQKSSGNAGNLSPIGMWFLLFIFKIQKRHKMGFMPRPSMLTFGNRTPCPVSLFYSFIKAVLNILEGINPSSSPCSTSLFTGISSWSHSQVTSRYVTAGSTFASCLSPTFLHRFPSQKEFKTLIGLLFLFTFQKPLPSSTGSPRGHRLRNTQPEGWGKKMALHRCPNATYKDKKSSQKQWQKNSLAFLTEVFKRIWYLCIIRAKRSMLIICFGLLFKASVG